MPRPLPLVPLHGAVNFDKLVPFDSAPNSPPLAATDILVMRRAAGGDNVTLSIGDITATGSVNIANLIGGNNNDMLYKAAGVWTTTGPVGLSYDGINMILTNDNLNFQGTGGIFAFGSGVWRHSGTGNIEQAGSGNIAVTGTGHLVMSAATAQIRAAFGSAPLPGITFDGDNDTGFYRSAGNRVAVSVAGVGHWEYNGLSYEGMAAGAPSLIDVDSTGVIPNILPNRSDANTGIGSSGNDNLSIIAGGVEIARAKEAVNDNSFLVTQGDNNTPGIGFLNDEDTGFANTAANQITAINAGTRTWHFTTAQFFSQFSNGPALINAAAGIAQVNIRPDRSTAGTGFSAGGSGEIGMVSNGILIATVRGQAANNQLQVVASGSSAVPELAGLADADTGLQWNGGNDLRVLSGGAHQFSFVSTSFQTNASQGPSIINAAAGLTSPNIRPVQSDGDTGISGNDADTLGIVAGGVLGFQVAEAAAVITNTIFGNLIANGGGGAGPLIKNEGASGTNPVFCPNQADPDTGLTRSGVNQSSIVNGGVEALRVRATTATVAANSNLLIFDYDDTVLKFVQFGADDSGGAGFKMCRVIN